jgi:hypothetical protein
MDEVQDFGELPAGAQRGQSPGARCAATSASEKKWSLNARRKKKGGFAQQRSSSNGEQEIDRVPNIDRGRGAAYEP